SSQAGPALERTAGPRARRRTRTEQQSKPGYLRRGTQTSTLPHGCRQVRAALRRSYPRALTRAGHSGSHAGVSRLIRTGRKALGPVCSPVAVSSAPVRTNANYGKALQSQYRKWMSGCENLLVNENENRNSSANRKKLFRRATGF